MLKSRLASAAITFSGLTMFACANESNPTTTATTVRAASDGFGLGNGQDGALVVNAAGTQINAYAQVTGNLAKGVSSIPVSTAVGFAANDELPANSIMRRLKRMHRGHRHRNNARIREGNRRFDAKIAALKAALTREGLEQAVFDPTRLAQNNRSGRKLMQAYFRQRGVSVRFSAS